MSDIRVTAGQSLQTAIDLAASGDVIRLEAGVTFTGNIIPKSNLTITSDGILPDHRVSLSDVLPRLFSGNGAPVFELRGLTNVRLIGLDFLPNVGGSGDVIQVNDCQGVEVDRCRLIVPDGQQQKRFFLGNGRSITFTRSYVSNLWREGQDSQAFCAWDGAGPYLIDDCYLEAASENIMFGGADASSPEAVPADIVVSGCHLTKNLAWKGHARVVKNLFELKAAKRVTVRDCLLEHCWADAQGGTAVVLTPVNQLAAAPWSVIEDVIFERVTVRDTENGVTVTGYGYQYEPGSGGPTGQTTRIKFQDCTIQAHQRAFFVANEIGSLSVFRNRLGLPPGGVSLSLDATRVWPEGEAERPAQFAVADLTWAENDVPADSYIHSSTATGEAALQAYTLRYTWTATEEPPAEPPPTVDPLAALVARLDAMQAETAATSARVSTLATYLSKVPNGKIQTVIQYLRGVPR